MTTVDTPSHEKDFYAQLMVEIEAGRVEHAISLVLALKERPLQTEILTQLAGSLDHALDIRGASTLDLDRARALVRARERANELAIDLDLDHAYALEIAIERARAIYLYLDQAGQINKTIIGCLTALKAKDKLSQAKTVRVTRSTSAVHKSNRGRVIMIALVCTLLLVGVIALMVLQSKSKNDAAATSTTFAHQQTDMTATDYVTPNK